MAFIISGEPKGFPGQVGRDVTGSPGVTVRHPIIIGFVLPAAISIARMKFA